MIKLYLEWYSTSDIGKLANKTIKHFSEWIYKDKELFLQRKYEIFQQKK
ncbi:hypothetical protein QUF99_16320 [Bacillus sp. DX4.1]|nr:hypothetical protein [Bacillus sp. DX4.1]MDM5188825.1 hypothetical protein [Bacillus sp. DX4.1]